MYFGGRVGGAPKGFVCQLVHLREIQAGKGREFGLTRSRGAFSLEAGVKPDLGSMGLATTYLSPPENEEQLLELEVKPNGLAVVRWNGVGCPELVNDKACAKARELFPDLHLVGEFGVYCNGTTVTVSTARYVPTE